MGDEFFLKKMKGVTPLTKDENTKKVKKTYNKNYLKKNSLKKSIETKQNDLKTQIKKSKFELSFGEINKDLKRGKIDIDRRIDLHGYSLLEAYEKFKKEVKKTYEKNKRCILVITGKGLHVNTNNPEPKLFYGKIKNAIVSWIEEEDLKKYILTYQDAGLDYGGDGAIFVYLRKKTKPF